VRSDVEVFDLLDSFLLLLSRSPFLDVLSSSRLDFFPLDLLSSPWYLSLFLGVSNLDVEGGGTTTTGRDVNLERTVVEADAALLRARDLVDDVSLTGEGGEREIECRRLSCRTGESGEEEEFRR
jgi:hypothetical protein